MSRHYKNRQPEMTELLRYQGLSGARPCQGRSSLDRACAPAEYGSYRKARTGKISHIRVSTLSGEPRVGALAGLLPPRGAFAGALVLDVDDGQPEQLDHRVVGREVAAGLG